MNTEPAPTRLLLVDDEPSLREPLAEYLSRQGFVVRQAEDASKARSALLEEIPDLVLLDIMMPGEDGLSLCRHLTETRNLPVILLTARGEAMDRIVGLEIGADDYVSKPFEPRELVARIRSVLRRIAKGGPPPEEDAFYEFDGWQLDPLKRKLTDQQGAVVPISSAEFRLLVAFLNHPRQVLDRDRLLDMVQGREAHLFDRAVDNQVSRLRRKMETDSRDPKLIQTVWGGGYTLAADVRRTTCGTRLMRRFLPKSLLGQMLLAVAAALLVTQAISAVLLYRSLEARRELGAINGLAFQLVAEPRIDFRTGSGRGRMGNNGRVWHRLQLENSTASPLRPGEQRQSQREDQLRQILVEQGVAIGDLVVTSRPVRSDAFVAARLPQGSRWRGDDNWRDGQLLVAGLRREGAGQWLVARIPLPAPEPRALGSVIMQTLLLYVVLVGGLALLLRRITRPLAALTRRLETFGETRATDGQLEPSGPEDTRRLIAAHNAMERRIAALLDEKDVMLGAIGHDLKTPLAALRVRIESVE